jgi:glucose/arabinose dehydrogenase
LRRKAHVILLIVFLLAGCAGAAQPTPPPSSALLSATPAVVAELGTTAAAAPSAMMATATAAANGAATLLVTATLSAAITPDVSVNPAPAAALTPTITPRPATQAATATPASAGTARVRTTTPAPVAKPQATAATTGAAVAAQPANSLQLQLVAQGLTAPVYLISAPDNSGRLFVVDQIGLVRIIGANGAVLDTPFLDLRDQMVSLNRGYDERGLLGLAFHPDYAHNGRFFVYYSAPLRQGGPAGWDNTIHLSEFKVSSDPNRADPGSERMIMQIDEPQATHEGGALVFGPDGELYIGVGDGGGSGDKDMGHSPGGNGQDTNVLLGKILRIDVDHGQPYAIPADNPFVNGGGAREIYAYGFRNPYRLSFDLGESHQLFVADVGQNLFEEVDILTKGGNYGWNIREGLHCFDPNNQSSPPVSCPSVGARGEPLLDPILEQDHSQGIAIIGGYVYRGRAVSGLAGNYFFGQWAMSFTSATGRLYAATRLAAGGQTWAVRELSVAGNPGGSLGHFLLGFGQDGQQELYVLVSNNSGPAGASGKVYKIVGGS